eukprot:gene12083-18672_t
MRVLSRISVCRRWPGSSFSEWAVPPDRQKFAARTEAAGAPVQPPRERCAAAHAREGPRRYPQTQHTLPRGGQSGTDSSKQSAGIFEGIRESESAGRPDGVPGGTPSGDGLGQFIYRLDRCEKEGKTLTDAECAREIELAWGSVTASTRRGHDFADGRRKWRAMFYALDTLVCHRHVVFIRSVNKCISLAGYARSSRLVDAVLRKMITLRIPPDGITQTLVASAYANVGDLPMVLRILGAANDPRSWLASDTASDTREDHPGGNLEAAGVEKGAQSRLGGEEGVEGSAERYSKAGNVHQGSGSIFDLVRVARADEERTRLVLKAMANSSGDRHQGNALRLLNAVNPRRRTARLYLHAIECCRGARLAVSLLREMEAAGTPPNAFHYNAALQACSRDRDISSADAMLTRMRTAGVDLNDTARHTLMTLFGRKGKLDRVDSVMRKVETPTAETFTAYINAMCFGLVREKGGSELVIKAEAAFHMARAEGKDSVFVWTGIMAVYAAAGGMRRRAQSLWGDYKVAAGAGYLPPPSPKLKAIAAAATGLSGDRPPVHPSIVVAQLDSAGLLQTTDAAADAAAVRRSLRSRGKPPRES